MTTPAIMIRLLASFIVAGFASLAIPVRAWSAPLPPTAELAPEQVTSLLALHNRARRAVGVADLQWSKELADTARVWAGRLRGEDCAMRHSGTPGVGENLAWAAGQHLSPAEVVALWVKEARSFNPTTGICAPGPVCGHYTQVVWRNTRFVGCAVALCANSEVWVCNYSPPGNVVGQRPY